MMNAVWVMLVMICPGLNGQPGCSTSVVPGHFLTQQSCKEIGGLMKSQRVSFVCIRSWENKA
jgi:hypothetical protein